MVSWDLRQANPLLEAESENDRAGYYWDSPLVADLSLHFDHLEMVHLQVVSLDLALDAHLATVASDNDLLGHPPGTVLGVIQFWVVDSLALAHFELLRHTLPET